jgi:hypothetical protein
MNRQRATSVNWRCWKTGCCFNGVPQAANKGRREMDELREEWFENVCCVKFALLRN